MEVVSLNLLMKILLKWGFLPQDPPALPKVGKMIVTFCESEKLKLRFDAIDEAGCPFGVCLVQEKDFKFPVLIQQILKLF